MANGTTAGAESSVRLADRARGGEREAFDRLIARYLRPLQAWATARLPARLRREERLDPLVRDAMLESLETMGRQPVADDGEFQLLLRRAVRDRAAGLAREDARLEDQPAADNRDPPTLPEAAGGAAYERYERTLETLGGQERAAIVARVEFGQDWDEVGRALGGASAEQARSRVCRAVLELAGATAGEAATDASLGALAAAVADRAPVDWDERLRRAPDERERGIVRQMQVIAQVARSVVTSEGAASLVGRALGHIRVLEKIGEGGMGQVFRAHDEHLKRDVAIKVLSPGLLADDDARRRFRNEALSLSRVNHPNVETVYDFDTQDGIDYLVLEYLPGKTLRTLLAEGALPEREVIRLGIQLAEGLRAAHGQGIVHRDLKPGNVMIMPEGQLKILDFGLAKFVRPAEDGTTTRTLDAHIVGTLPYMSPEQLRGTRVDARSDIFSLGCVLYEMLSGTNPFRKATPADTVSAILSQDPGRLAALRPMLPPALDLLVARCLEKDPDRRFDSARDVAFAMEALSDSQSGPRPVPRPRPWVSGRVIRWTGAGLAVVAAVVAAMVVPPRVPPLPDEKHVAVLRFQASGADASQQVFADGLTEMTATGLLLLTEQTRGALWSVPRQSLSLEERASIEAVRRKFGINLTVNGRLERSGDSLRLTLSIVDARSLRVIRESTIEDDLDNLSVFQLGPILRIAELLGVEVRPETLEGLQARVTNHAVAFSSFVRGSGLLAAPYDEAKIAAAESSLLEAIAADPLYSPAREALAWAYLERYNATHDPVWLEKGLSSTAEVARRAPTEPAFLLEADLHTAAGDHEAAADALARAARMYPASGHVQLALGRAYHSLRRDLEAERAYERAINLLPGYWLAHFWMAMLDFERGRYDAAANEWREVIRCAPEYDGGYTNLGMVYYMLERRADARAMFEHALELTAGSDYIALSNLGTLSFEESRFAEAAEFFERAVAVYDGHHSVWGNLGEAYAATRFPEKAELPFRRAIELAEQERAATPEDPALLGALASYHAMLGERKEAIGLLEAAVALDPTDPNVLAVIGETFEDAGDRERALEWVGRAVEGGVPFSRFSTRPSLRGLVDDPRFQQLASERSHL